MSRDHSQQASRWMIPPFIPNGPLLPDALLRAQEEGRLIFWVGSGVSRKAGLPDWKRLLDEVRIGVNTSAVASANASEECPPPDRLDPEAYKLDPEEEFQQLESGSDRTTRAVVGACSRVREIVDAKLRNIQGELSSHEALLKLSLVQAHSSNSDTGIVPSAAAAPWERLRLVTTNFDLCFSMARNTLRRQIGSSVAGDDATDFIAPLLPVPKSADLEGIVYLHGRLGVPAHSARAGKSLVLTSADYGRAYISERWASEFATELFRNFTVCFVGYSFADKVIRYLRDAISGECEPGGRFRCPYIFSLNSDDLDRDARSASGIQIITYQEGATGKDDHGLLHATLCKWADSYWSGRTSRAAVVEEFQGTAPGAAEPGAVARVDWALRDPQGRAAWQLATPGGRAATVPPTVLPVEWIEECQLSEGEDSPLFAARLPDSSHCLAPAYEPLALWFAEQADRVPAVRWFCASDGDVDPRLARALRGVLHGLGGRQWSSGARQFWGLAIANCTGRGRFDALDYRDLLQKWDSSLEAVREIRRRLEPRLLRIGEPMEAWQGDDAATVDSLGQWAVGFADERAGLEITNLLYPNGEPRSDASIPFSRALADALADLIDDASEISELTRLGPSAVRRDINGLKDDAWRNGRWQEFFMLPMLLSEVLFEGDRLRVEARDWVRTVLSTRKSWLSDRILLKCAHADAELPCADWVNWLLDRGGARLWMPYSHERVVSLLRQRGSQLAPKQAKSLLRAIRGGPPSALGLEQSDEEREWLVYTRLRALDESGLGASGTVDEQIQTLQAAPRTWGALNGAQLEGRCPRQGSSSDHLRPAVPWFASDDELCSWIAELPVEPSSVSRLMQVTQQQQPNLLIGACRRLLAKPGASEEGIIDACLEALSVATLSQEDFERLLSLVKETHPTFSDSAIRARTRSLALALARLACATSLPTAEIVLELVRLARALRSVEFTRTSDSFADGLNTPPGVLAQALLACWMRADQRPDDNVRAQIKEALSTLMTDPGQFAAAVVLGKHLNQLFIVEPSWTREKLMTRMTGPRASLDHVAQGLWLGFALAARVLPAVFDELARSFMGVAEFIRSDARAGPAFARMATVAVVDSVGEVSDEEWRLLFAQFDDEQLVASAEQLARLLGAAGARSQAWWASGGAACRVVGVWPTALPREAQAGEAMAATLISALLLNPDSLSAALPCVRPWIRGCAGHRFHVDDALVAWARQPQTTRSNLHALDELLRICAISGAAATAEASNEVMQAIRERLEIPQG